MRRRSHLFLLVRLKPVISKFAFSRRQGPKGIAVYIIQLRRPDYWIIFVSRTKRSSTRLIFDGPWRKAVEYFSDRPKTFPDPKLSGLPESSEESLYSFVRQVLRDRFITLARELVNGSPYISAFAAGLWVFSDFGTLDARERYYFESFLKNKAKKPPTEKPAPPFERAKHERKAYFCRFPMIVNQSSPNLDLRAEINREINFEQVAFNLGLFRRFKYHGVRLAVFEQGYLVADERHQALAMEALNAFLAFAFFSGAGCEPANAQDSGDIQIDVNGETKSWSGYRSALRKGILTKKSIPVADLNLIVDRFEKLIDKELSLELRLLHLSYFHFNAGEFLQAFTLAWIVVERRITRLWKDKLASRGYSESRLNELCDSERYTTSVKIDVLELLTDLPPDQRAELHSIRKARNKASHEGRIPTMEETANCLRIARDLVRSYWPDLKIDVLPVPGA